MYVESLKSVIVITDRLRIVKFIVFRTAGFVGVVLGCSETYSAGSSVGEYVSVPSHQASVGRNFLRNLLVEFLVCYTSNWLVNWIIVQFRVS